MLSHRTKDRGEWIFNLAHGNEFVRGSAGRRRRSAQDEIRADGSLARGKMGALLLWLLATETKKNYYFFFFFLLCYHEDCYSICSFRICVSLVVLVDDEDLVWTLGDFSAIPDPRRRSLPAFHSIFNPTQVQIDSTPSTTTRQKNNIHNNLLSKGGSRRI